MKIIWRNPKRTAPKKVFIINTRRVDSEYVAKRFYHCSSGVGILGTEFELQVNRTS